MGIIGGKIGYLMLRALSQGGRSSSNPENDQGAKLIQFFGQDFFNLIQGKTVIDFGCGNGSQAVELAIKGAGRVIGLDIQENLLSIGRDRAERKSVTDRCTFTTSSNELADIIISKDAFEHFSDLDDILRSMRSLLKPEGFVLAGFGPTWLHPYGGHLFSVFPWAHLLFTENSLIRWRSDFKSDGARKFSEVEGGLNQLTIREFEQVVEKSPLKFEWLDTVPIRGIHLLKNRAFREFGSSIVRCKLVPRKK